MSFKYKVALSGLMVKYILHWLSKSNVQFLSDLQFIISILPATL